MPARSHALVSDAVAAAPAENDSGAPPCWEQDDRFTEISPIRSHESLWDDTLFGALATSAVILELEARALNQAMRRVCGAAASMNTRHLILCDNMAATLSFDRFRARS